MKFPQPESRRDAGVLSCRKVAPFELDKVALACGHSGCLNFLFERHSALSRIEQSMYPDKSANSSVEQVLARAHQELISLEQERARIMERIGAIKQTIAGLANVFGEALLGDELLDLIDRRRGDPSSGLTRTCRATLMESDLPLTTQRILEEIQGRQPKLLAHHKSPVASVTTILNRLVHYGEARVTTTLSGKRAWQWATVPNKNATSEAVALGTPAKTFDQPPVR